jgi:hypothetical protein
MHAAWETWIEDENRRCRAVQSLVLDETQANGTDIGKDVRTWYERYCSSCERAYEKVKR